MVASAIFFLDDKGNPLLSRNYRGDIPMSTVENFPKLLLQAEEKSSNVPPCFSFEGINYVYITHNNIYVLALTKLNSNVASMLLFLHHIIGVLQEYLKEVEEESIRDNFVVIYELLDEMMDFGHPQVTDHKFLQEYITQESHELDKASSTVGSGISWRPEGISYKKNELFMDVVESFNALLAADGTVIKSEIVGKVNVNAYLSGMPVLKLGLNDGQKQKPNSSTTVAKKKNRSVELEDVKFHQCVQLEQFEKDRTIQFIPPDGKFELMSYRIREVTAKPLILVKAEIDVRSRSRVIVTASAKSQYRRRSTGNVEIAIPVPPDADSPRFKAQAGSVVYAPEKNAILWKIKNLNGGQDLIMKAELQLSSINDTDDYVDSNSAYRGGSGVAKQPIRVTFDIPYLAVSGLQVRYLKVTEPRLQYQSLPWVRYITQSGDDYTIRLPTKQ